MDAPTGHGGGRRRGGLWRRATSRRARPAERRDQSTFPAPRIARRKKVSLLGGTSHRPPRYTCCNQIISQSQGGGRITRSTDLGRGQPLPLVPESMVESKGHPLPLLPDLDEMISLFSS